MRAAGYCYILNSQSRAGKDLASEMNKRRKNEGQTEEEVVTQFYDWYLGAIGEGEMRQSPLCSLWIARSRAKPAGFGNPAEAAQVGYLFPNPIIALLR